MLRLIPASLPLDLCFALVVDVEICSSDACADLEAGQRVAQDQVEGVSLHVGRRKILRKVQRPLRRRRAWLFRVPARKVCRRKQDRLRVSVKMYYLVFLSLVMLVAL